MALNVKAGTITSRTSTGSQGYTGVGFQPKVVLWSTSRVAGDGATAGLYMGFGATNATSDYSIATYYADARTTTALNGNYDSNGRSVPSTRVSDLNYLADCTSLDADGFTLNWLAVEGTGRTIGYIALGGTDFTNVNIGTFDQSTGTGSLSKTGVGFQPDFIIFFREFSTTSTGGVDSSGSGGMTIGMASSSSNQGHTHIYGEHGSAVNALTKHYQRTNSCYSQTNGSSVVDEFAFTSFDADGFTVNRTTNSGSKIVFYVAFKLGGKVSVGNETSATSVTTKATTGLSFVPKGMILVSANSANSTGIDSDEKMTIGFGSGASNSANISGASDDGVSIASGTVADSYADSSNIYRSITQGTPTTNTVGDISSFDSTGGFTMDWTTASGTAEQFIFAVFGDTAASGGGTSYGQECLAAITLVDTPIKYPQRITTDALVLTATPIKSTARSLSDPLVLIDTVLKNIGRTLSETITLVDSYLRSIIKNLVEALTFTDTPRPRKAFGFTSIGDTTTSTIVSNRVVGSKFTLSENGTATAIWIYFNSVSDPSSTIYGVIYSDVTGTPTALMASSNRLIPNSPGWYEFEIGTPVALSAGTYWIAENHGFNNITLKYSAGASNQGFIATDVPPPADPASSSSRTFDTNKYSMYVTYLTSGSNAFTQVLTDILALVDTPIRSISRTLNDGVVFVDTVIKSTLKTISQALVLQDVFAGIKVAVKELLESIVLNDTIIRSIGALRTETMALTDTVIKSISRTINQSLVIQDVLTALKGFFRTIEEAITLTDTTVRSVSRTINQALELSVNAIKSTARTITQQLVLSDVFASIKAIVREILESITLNGTITRSISAVRTETLQLVDNVYKSISRTITQTLNLADVFAGEIVIIVISSIKTIGRFIIYATKKAHIIKDKPKQFTLYEKGRDNDLNTN